MSENRFWRAFGLTEPSEGGQEQEAAAPAAQTRSEGGQEQEVAAPANTETEQTVTERTEATPPGESVSPDIPAEQLRDEAQNAPEADAAAETRKETKALTAQERREQAAARRERERRDAAEQMRKEIAAELLKKLNIRDPANENKPIASYDELEKYTAAQTAARLKREVKNGELTPETLEAVVLQNPKIRAVVETAEQQRLQAQEAEEKARLAAYNANLHRQIGEIRRINPAVNSLDDIIRMDTGADFAKYIRRGMEPVEAYKLANHEAIVSRARAAAEQQARNAAAGKAHLQGTGAAGKPPLEVSEQVRNRYRKFTGGIPDERIAEIEARIRSKNE